MNYWIEQAVFYHIYPLGFFGAPLKNQENGVQHRILKLKEWISHLKSLNINAIYLGPIFSSSEHGYDTKDYYKIDERLGTAEDFKEICDLLHKNNIKIVLDGVFNHVGREFWAFKDVLEKKEASKYIDWFSNINFHQSTPYQDPFSYDCWEGHYNLVKLNLNNSQVVEHLINAVDMWIEVFDIDGIRLDAANCIEPQFFVKLKQFTQEKKHDFWLMGEIIHGDYSRWVNKEMLDSVTNYEVYKGIYSSHNDKNYFEIAHSFQRLYGNGGLYQNFLTYNFVDNHDVNRIISNLRDSRDIFNVYTMLYLAPGIPSIYYGSEWGIEGKRTNTSDEMLRPCLDLKQWVDKYPSLVQHISFLGYLKNNVSALHGNEYEALVIRNQQLVFHRYHKDSHIYAVFNCGEEDYELSFSVQEYYVWYDLLNRNEYHIEDGKIHVKVSAKNSIILCNSFINGNSMDEVNEHDIEKKLGVYQHYKGKQYRVLGFAKHSETLEEYVMYQQLYGDESYWIRPSSMFFEEVETNGKKVRRFQWMKD